MSDNDTLSRAEQVRRRREEESKQRVTSTKTRVGGSRKDPPTSRKPSTRKPTERPVLTRTPIRKSTAQRSSFGAGRTRQYNAAYSMPISRGAAKPAMVPIEIGERMVSGGIALVCLALVVWMLSMPPFVFTSVELFGSQRVSSLEVNSATGLVGRSILFAVPEQIEANVRAAFPEFSDVKVSVNIPNLVSIQVSERTPVVAWQYQERLTWIDAEGIGFTSRGSAENIVPVMAFGMPAGQVQGFDPLNLDKTTPLFVAPETVLAIQSLQSYVPAGTIMIYEPQYGLGWNDPRGWQVFFGMTGRDIPLKLQVYQSVVDNLLQRGVQPTLISVEYPDAPFYRAEP